MVKYCKCFYACFRVNGKNVKKMPSRGVYRSPVPGAYTTWDTDKDEVEVSARQWSKYSKLLVLKDQTAREI